MSYKILTDIYGGKLKVLTFDEEASDNLIDTYLPTTDFYSDIKSTDILFLKSTIRTGLNSRTLGSFTAYTEYYWILEKKDSSWKIIYNGFLT